MPEAPLLPEGPILLLAPHPDDETIGAGGLLSMACARGVEVWVVVVTAGDAFRWNWRYAWPSPATRLALGSDRLREARLATTRLGVAADHLALLGFPDDGLAALLNGHGRTPYRSPATGACAVPYPAAFAPGTPYTGAALRASLLSLLDRVQPRSVLAPGPLDHHADHRALSRLARQLAPPERLFYYPDDGALTWPFPKGLHPDWSLEPPPAYGDLTWLRYPLDARARASKRAALEAHVSQLGLMAPSMQAYLRRNELLLPATLLDRA